MLFVKTRWPPPLDKGFTMDHNDGKMNKCFFLSDTNTVKVNQKSKVVTTTRHSYHTQEPMGK